MSCDVTYCKSDCENRKCELHYCHAYKSYLWKGFASVADRSKDCRDYKKKVNKEDGT